MICSGRGLRLTLSLSPSLSSSFSESIASLEERHPRRITCLIDPEGVIERFFVEIDPATHPGEVLQALDK